MSTRMIVTSLVALGAGVALTGYALARSKDHEIAQLKAELAAVRASQAATVAALAAAAPPPPVAATGALLGNPPIDGAAILNHDRLAVLYTFGRPLPENAMTKENPSDMYVLKGNPFNLSVVYQHDRAVRLVVAFRDVASHRDEVLRWLGYKPDTDAVIWEAAVDNFAAVSLKGHALADEKLRQDRRRREDATAEVEAEQAAELLNAENPDRIHLTIRRATDAALRAPVAGGGKSGAGGL